MSAANHTPGPWKIGAHIGENNRLIVTNGRTPKRIARLYYGRTAADVSPIESQANAAFIVRACNSHAALVEALEQAERRLVDLRADETGPCPTLEKVRAALALAKEGQK